MLSAMLISFSDQQYTRVFVPYLFSYLVGPHLTAGVAISPRQVSRYVTQNLGMGCANYMGTGELPIPTRGWKAAARANI